VTGLFIPVLAFSAALTTVVAIPLMLVTAAVYNGPADQPDLVLPALAVVLAYIVFDNTSLNLDGVFSAFRSGRELFIGRFLQLAGFPILAIMLAPWHRDVVALTAATIASMGVALLVRLFLVRSFLAFRASGSAVRQGIRDLPDLLRFGLRVLPAQLSAGIADQASTWVLSVLLPVSVIGGWSRASGLASRLTEAGWRVCEILFPTLVQHHRNGDTTSFNRVLSTTVRVTAIAILLPAAVGAGAAEGILNIFGPGFAVVSGAFGILLFTYAIGVVGLALGQPLMAAGTPHLVSVIGVTRAVVGLAFLVPLAIVGGTIGAASALLLGVMAEVFLGSWYAAKLYGRSSLPGVGAVLGVLAGSLVAFVVSRVIDVYASSFIGALLAMAVGTIFYVAVVLPTATQQSERAVVWRKLRSLRSGRAGPARPVASDGEGPTGS
jgi:O-antigen/teichoic acid export membrane protein